MPCERTKWSVVYLMGVFSLIQNTQYSIYITTMYSYLKQLDPSATETQYGWIMATSSFGHCIGCFVLGWWNSRIGKSAPSMHLGFLLMLASNLVYLLVDHVPVSLVAHTMMISRLLGGLGMGNSSPMRTCATLHSTSSDRSKAMASISGGRSVGTVVGPGLQLLFVPLGEAGFTILPNILNFHSNNAPAYLGVFLTMIGFVSLIVLFEEEDTVNEEDKIAAISDFENQFNTVKEEYPSPDKLAMIICMLTRFVQNFMQISLDTLAPSFFMLMYLQTRQDATVSMSTMGLVTGCVATILYLLFIFTKLSIYVRDKIFNSVVLLLFVVHLLFTYSWPFYSKQEFNPLQSNVTGCDPSQFQWCLNLTVPPIWLYYLGYILSFGLFMPFINVANATLYSRLLHPDNQGTHQSLYDISNTTARIFAPILITTIYTAFGPRRAWEFLCILLLFTTFLWIVFDKRMVPLKALHKSNIFDNDGFEGSEKSSKTKLVS